MAPTPRRQQTTIALFSPVENVDWTEGVHYRVDPRGRVLIVAFPEGVETQINPDTGEVQTTHEITMSWGVA